MAAALAPFHPRARGVPKDDPFVWDEMTLRNATASLLQTDIGAIDLLAEVGGLGAYEVVKSRSIRVHAFGCEISTLDLAALIQAKRAAGREKDLLALRELESLLEADEV